MMPNMVNNKMIKKRVRKTRRTPLPRGVEEIKQTQEVDEVQGIQEIQAVQEIQEIQEKEERRSCYICMEPIRYYAIGQCEHVDLCALCALRLRLLVKDYTCPLCKQTHEYMVISPRILLTENVLSIIESCEEQLNGSNGINGAKGVKGPHKLKEVITYERGKCIFYYANEMYRKIMTLTAFKCRGIACHAKFKSFIHLQTHMKRNHHLEFCTLCVENAHFFMKEYQAYGKKKLMAHMKETEKEETEPQRDQRREGGRPKKQERHPLCEFCHQRYYNSEFLYKHLQKDHFSCFLCRQEQQYYRTYKELEKHFRKQHYLCEEKECREQTHIVFDTEMELTLHRKNTHELHNQKQKSKVRISLHNDGRQPNNSRMQRQRYIPTQWTEERQREEVVEQGQRERQAGGGQGEEQELWLAERRNELPNARRAQRFQDHFPPLPNVAPAPTVAAKSRPSTDSFCRASLMSNIPPPSQMGKLEKNTSTKVFDLKKRMERNQIVAEALKVEKSTDLTTLINPFYEVELYEWANKNVYQVRNVEKQFQRLLQDPKMQSTQFRAMPSEQRKCIHMYAMHIGFLSQAFDPEPYRYVSVIKQRASVPPETWLSEAIQLLQQMKEQRRNNVEGKKSEEKSGGGARSWKNSVQTVMLLQDAWSDEENEANEEHEENEESDEKNDIRVPSTAIY